MDKVALFFSYLFHPIFLPIITTFFFFNRMLMSYPVFGWTIYGIIFFNTLILPYLFYRYIQKKNTLKPNGEKKTILYSLLFNLYSYALVAILFKYFGIGIYIESLFFSISAVTLVALIISFFWKISLHLLGIGSITGFTLSYIFFFKVNILTTFVVILIVSAIVAASRLRLNAHSPAQVYAGFIVGVGITMLTTYLNLSYYMSNYFNQIF